MSKCLLTPKKSKPMQMQTVMQNHRYNIEKGKHTADTNQFTFVQDFKETQAKYII